MINLASKINPQKLDNFNVKISRITGRCQVIRTLMDMEYFLCKKNEFRTICDIFFYCNRIYQIYYYIGFYCYWDRRCIYPRLA